MAVTKSNDLEALLFEFARLRYQSKIPTCYGAAFSNTIFRYNSHVFKFYFVISVGHCLLIQTRKVQGVENPGLTGKSALQYTMNTEQMLFVERCPAKCMTTKYYGAAQIR